MLEDSQSLTDQLAEVQKEKDDLTTQLQNLQDQYNQLEEAGRAKDEHLAELSATHEAAEEARQDKGDERGELR